MSTFKDRLEERRREDFKGAVTAQGASCLNPYDAYELGARSALYLVADIIEDTDRTGNDEQPVWVAVHELRARAKELS